MIKKTLKKVILSLALSTASLIAGEISYDDFQTKSLAGVEGGYNAIGYEYGTPSNNTIKRKWVGHAGLKIGAETKDFRAFLSGRYYYDSSRQYNYIVTYGGEIQYKFNVTELFNLFIGANGGVANLAFRADGENFTRTISEPYFGGDLGANIHLGKSIDWELGGRVMSIQADNIKQVNGVYKTYHVNQLITAYTSIIFKWTMD